MNNLVSLSSLLLLVHFHLVHVRGFTLTRGTPATSSSCSSITSTSLFSTPPPSDDKGDDEGVSLAADFFKTMKSRNIQLDDDDFLDEDDEDDEEDDVTDTSDEDNVSSSLSDNKLNKELNERVLETAGGFVDLVSGASDDDEEEKGG